MAIKFLNTVAVDTDVLYVDASSNNVGIGTTSPHFYNNYRHLTINGTSGAGFMLKNGGSNKYEQYVDSGGAIFYLFDNDPLKFYTSGTERLRVTGTGNVGIGTTSPETKLDVIGEGAAIGTTGYYYNARFRDASNVGVMIGHNNVANGNGMIAGINKLAFLTYGTSWGERMIIDGSGNVGIGTTNPSEKLEVAGNARITGDVTLSNGNALRWTSDDVRIEGTTAGDNIKFYVANTEILQLAQSGTLATVTGNLRVTGAYYDSNNSAGTSGQILSSTGTATDWISLSEISGVDGTGTTNYVAKWSDTDTITDSVIYDDGTNVGVGVVPSSVTNGPHLEVGNLRGTVSAGTGYFEDNGNTNFLNGARPLAFGISNSEKMRIDSLGNVGIGTTSPSRKLQVQGTGNTALAITSPNTNYVQLALGDTDDDNYSQIILDNSTNKLQIQNGGGSIISNRGITLDSSENVGIGTDSPVNKLNVNGDIGYIGVIGQGSIYGNTGNSSYANMQLYNPSTGYSTFNNQSYGYYFQTAGSTKVTILNNGNVGIGTTSPSKKLHVAGDTQIDASGSGQTLLLGRANGQPTIKAQTDNGGHMIIDSTTNFMSLNHYVNKNVIMVAGGGNVGIGTTSPSYKLDVSEAARANGVRIGRDFSITNRGTVRIDSNGTSAPSDVLFGHTAAANESSWTGVYWSLSSRGTSDNGKFQLWRGSGHAAPYNSELRLITALPNGNVGIGANDPGSKLHVASNATNTVEIYGAGNKTMFSYSDSGGVGWCTDEGAGNWVNLLYLDKNNNAVNIYSNGSFNTTFNSQGNVGIGTTSPYGRLNVIPSSNPTTPTAANQISIGESSANSQYNLRLGYFLEGGAYKGSIQAISGNTPNTLILNGDGGNVGIGTTTPGSRRLGIYTSASSNDVGIESKILRTSGTNYSFLGLASGSGADQNIGGFFSATGATTNTALWAYDGEVLLATQSTTDYVGIGTTSPGAKLDVEGVSRISGDFAGTGQDPLLQFYNTDTSLGANQILGTIDFHQSDPSGGGVGVVSRIRAINDSSFKGEASLTFHTGEVGVSFEERMRINSAGNVGIGTTSPSQKAVISGPNTTPSLNTTAVSSASLLVSNSDTGYGTYFASTGGGIGLIQQRRQTSAVYYDLSLQPYGGNVGIGTTSPERQLSLYSNNTETTPRLLIEQEGTGDAVMAFSLTGGQGWSMGIDNSGGDSFMIHDSSGGVDSSSQFTIKTNGNVGIGTTSPSTKLEVSSSGAEGILISKDTGTPSNSGRLFFETDTISEGFSFLNSNGLMTIRSQAQAGVTSGNVRVAIDGSGNVGIGTTSPSHRLDVDGTARANNFISNNSSTVDQMTLSYKDQNKRTFNSILDFTFTGAGVYYFNVAFSSGGGFSFDVNMVTHRNGNYRNFGSIKDSGYMYWESDADFSHHAQGVSSIASTYQTGIYLDEAPTAFLANNITDTSQGTANYSYFIKRYAVYLPDNTTGADGFFKVTIDTYGYDGDTLYFLNT